VLTNIASNMLAGAGSDVAGIGSILAFDFFSDVPEVGLVVVEVAAGCADDVGGAHCIYGLYVWVWFRLSGDMMCQVAWEINNFF
jgi:hypothetical protein